MADFFKKNSFPLYGNLDGETFGHYMERGEGMIWTLMPMTKDTMKQVIEDNREKMTNIAKKFKGSFSVTYVNIEEFAKVIESMFGITEFPKIVVQKKAGDKKNYIYDGEMSEETITEYVEVRTTIIQISKKYGI